MRALLYEFPGRTELTTRLEEGDDGHELPVESGILREGEWVVATVVVGAECTSVAGLVVDRGDGDLGLTFAERDWEILWSFAEGEGRPSTPPPSQPRPCCEITAPPGSRVLLVDGDAALSGMLRCLLSRGGFEVDAAASGEEALDRLRGAPLHLVLVDATLPGMSGLEFCRRLRLEAALADVPVLYLANHGSPTEVSSALSVGASDCIGKPFRAHELGCRVMGLLRRAPLSA